MVKKITTCSDTRTNNIMDVLKQKKSNEMNVHCQMKGYNHCMSIQDALAPGWDIACCAWARRSLRLRSSFSLSICSRSSLLSSKSSFLLSIAWWCYDQFSSPVRMEQRQFGGQRDLDYSTPRVWWLCALLHGKAEMQGTRLSKPTWCCSIRPNSMESTRGLINAWHRNYHIQMRIGP